jgi:uncharacterized phosphosugar-binding protein
MRWDEVHKGEKIEPEEKKEEDNSGCVVAGALFFIVVVVLICIGVDDSHDTQWRNNSDYYSTDSAVVDSSAYAGDADSAYADSAVSVAPDENLTDSTSAVDESNYPDETSTYSSPYYQTTDDEGAEDPNTEETNEENDNSANSGYEQEYQQ